MVSSCLETPADLGTFLMPNPRTAAEWAEKLVTVRPCGQIGRDAQTIHLGEEMVGTAINPHWAEDVAGRLRLEITATIAAAVREALEMSEKQRVIALNPTTAARYRKKPIVIEAFQMTLTRRWDNSEWPSWLSEAWNMDIGEGAMWIDPDDSARERLVLGTKEGVHRVSWNDWIIRGIQGELYACKPDIFEATYEPV